MSIGERLEEARKRRGVSIREASDATKIRGEYLTFMEDDTIEKIDLPKIYVRGFLKNYAVFLKLNPDQILTDLDAHEISRASDETQPHHSGQADGRTKRGIFGHMEIPEDPTKPTHNTPKSSPRPKDTEPNFITTLTDNTLYLKIGVGVAAFLVLTLLVIILINVLGGNDSPALNPELGTSLTTTSQNEATTKTPIVSGPEIITLRAIDNVTLIIDQVDPAERLYQGTLTAGQVQSLEKTGAVSIRFSNGSAVEIIQADGKIVRPNQASIGRIIVK